MRHEDWPARMAAAIAARGDTPFRYGRFDCALFAADVIEAMTGTDPAAPWRGRYAGVKRADRIRREAGGLERLVTRQLGEAIPPRFARRGDVVFIDIDGGSLGICEGAQIVLPARPRGLARVPLTDAVSAWRV